MFKKKKKENKYYDINPILSKDAHYSIIIGKRSNGKTYAALDYGLRQYFEHGYEMAYLRRWTEDIRGHVARTIFDGHVNNKLISKYSKGEWTGVYYYNKCWYLARVNERGETEHSERPFCWAFSISDMERTKSTSFPHIKTIIYDEFLTKRGYLPDEFILFQNVISTIVRQNDDIKIFMLGNTVNQYSPYFTEMGLKHIKEMKPGTIDIYNYSNGLKVAVEYCATDEEEKTEIPSDVYFGFDNPKLKMITTGTWEMDIYPHCPTKYLHKDIVFSYYILFDDNILQGDIVCTKGSMFTYIHKKTTPIKDMDKDIIFCLKEDFRPNWFVSINKPSNKVTDRIWSMFVNNMVFYQDNEIGEMVSNYIKEC